jgi:hypothetical protein
MIAPWGMADAEDAVEDAFRGGGDVWDDGNKNDVMVCNRNARGGGVSCCQSCPPLPSHLVLVLLTAPRAASTTCQARRPYAWPISIAAKASENDGANQPPRHRFRCGGDVNIMVCQFTSLKEMKGRVVRVT